MTRFEFSPDLLRLGPGKFYEPVSLGELCEPKYQTARVLNARLCPDRSQMAFRYRIGTPTRDASISGWRFFDWRTTPLEAVCETLERDFQGAFELEDLTPTERGVKNTRFGTYHVHEFAPSSGRTLLTTEEMVRQYPQARRNYDLLAEDFRTLLRRPGPYLYVIQSPQFSEVATVQRLLSLLERDPIHQFHVLVVGVEGFDSDLSAAGSRVSKAWRVLDSGKPDKFQWEGNDASWDEILNGLPLGYHEAGFHDPLGLPGWAAPSLGGSSVAQAAKAPGRARQAASPPEGAEVVWRGGPEAVFCAEFWRDQGASLERRPDGALIRTIPKAWTYSQAAKLDFSEVDLHRQQAWIRLEIANVAGHLLAGLYDPLADVLADEIPIEAGRGPFQIYFTAKSKDQSVLMLRTGREDEVVEALVRNVEILAATV